MVHAWAMSQPPSDSESYEVPSQQMPPVAPPMSIGDAAAQYDAEQADGAFPGYGLPGYKAPAAVQPTATEMFTAAANRTALAPALASLFVGILALFTCLVPIIGVLFGAIAAILGGIGLAKGQPRALAGTGLALGVIALTISGIVTAVTFADVG